MEWAAGGYSQCESPRGSSDGTEHSERELETNFVLANAGLVTTSTGAARSQETEPLEDQGTKADRSSGSLPAQDGRRIRATEGSTPSPREASRGAWLKDSLMQFRPRRSEAEPGRPTPSVPYAPVETRRRSLLGREVLYAPCSADDLSGPSDPTVDRSVSPAADEAVQDQKQSTAVGRSRFELGSAGESSPGHKGNGQDPNSRLAGPFEFVAVAPIGRAGPTPTAARRPPMHLEAGRRCSPSLMVPSSDQPGTSERSAAEPEPSHGTPSAGDEKEPYIFCKRFLCRYPTLVDWFPDHLGLPPKTTECGCLRLGRGERARWQGARSSQVLPRASGRAPGTRRRFRCRSTRVIRSLESLQVRPIIRCRRLSIWARMGRA